MQPYTNIIREVYKKHKSNIRSVTEQTESTLTAILTLYGAHHTDFHKKKHEMNLSNPTQPPTVEHADTDGLQYIQVQGVQGM